ncbi:MAG: helix-turn-helix transcriptional regulator [Candidatus Cryptobacteroides sp.]|nr:helix-turn-helix domain-containing protein [Bacteroidales bacterium]
MMDLREVMKSRRKTLSITQNDLAEMAGVSLATVKDIERGKANPSMSTVLEILDVLGMEITYSVRQTVK